MSKETESLVKEHGKKAGKTIWETINEGVQFIGKKTGEFCDNTFSALGEGVGAVSDGIIRFSTRSAIRAGIMIPVLTMGGYVVNKYIDVDIHFNPDAHKEVISDIQQKIHNIFPSSTTNVRTPIAQAPQEASPYDNILKAFGERRAYQVDGTAYNTAKKHGFTIREPVNKTLENCRNVTPDAVIQFNVRKGIVVGCKPIQ